MRRARKTVAGGRREVGLGPGGPVEERGGVPDEHERRIGQAGAAAGPLQQRHAGLPLEHRELLGDGRRRVLERVGDRRDRAPVVQFAQQAEAAKVEHHEGTLPNRARNRCRR